MVVCCDHNSCPVGLTIDNSVPLSLEEGAQEQFFLWLLPLEDKTVKKKKVCVGGVLSASTRLLGSLLWLDPVPVLGSILEFPVDEQGA